MTGFATDRLEIEPLAVEHAVQLHAAFDHPEVERFLHGTHVTTLDAMRARIVHLIAGPPPDRTGERWWNFAVWLRAERSIIGQLEATIYGDWAEIAYVFGPRWWGRGLASEATRWLVGHLTEHGIAELWAAVHPANLASRRLLARVGFTAVERADRPLGSFDPGDDVYVRRG
jgi:RimJ/RimL family protein N-acetyltransferase